MVKMFFERQNSVPRSRWLRCDQQHARRKKENRGSLVLLINIRRPVRNFVLTSPCTYLRSDPFGRFSRRVLIYLEHFSVPLAVIRLTFWEGRTFGLTGIRQVHMLPGTNIRRLIVVLDLLCS